MITEILIERYTVLHMDLINTLLSIRVDNYRMKEFRRFDNIKSQIFIISRYLEINDEYIRLLERIESSFIFKDIDDDMYLELVDGLSDAFENYVEEKNGKIMDVFAKERLFVCVEKIYDYLNNIEFDIENEDRYDKLMNELRIQSIGIPKNIYIMVEKFVAENIGKYVINGFNYNFSDDEVENLSDGTIRLKNEKALSQLLIGYGQEIEDIKKRFNEFIKINIKPLLEVMA